MCVRADQEDVSDVVQLDPIENFLTLTSVMGPAIKVSEIFDARGYAGIAFIRIYARNSAIGTTSRR